MADILSAATLAPHSRAAAGEPATVLPPHPGRRRGVARLIAVLQPATISGPEGPRVQVLVSFQPPYSPRAPRLRLLWRVCNDRLAAIADLNVLMQHRHGLRRAGFPAVATSACRFWVASKHSTFSRRTCSTGGRAACPGTRLSIVRPCRRLHPEHMHGHDGCSSIFSTLLVARALTAASTAGSRRTGIECRVNPVGGRFDTDAFGNVNVFTRPEVGGRTVRPSGPASLASCS